jgi:hypothetical protein
VVVRAAPLVMLTSSLVNVLMSVAVADHEL